MNGTERRSQREIELETEIERLKRELNFDSKTGAYNSRAFDAEMRSLEQLVKKGLLSQLSLVLADVDNFKVYNDTLGHDFGDEVLRTVAIAMQAAGRKDLDTVFRFGDRSDEFGILLPGADEMITNRIMQNITRNLQMYPAMLEGESRVVDISMGVAVFPDTLLSKLRKKADNQLIVAKAQKHVGR